MARDDSGGNGSGPRANQLDGKVAIVTGASAGIGAAIAVRLAAEGARVALADINAAGLDKVRRRIEADGGSATALPADVRNRAQVERMARVAFKTLGPIDCLVNNAGVYWTTPFLSLTEREWDRVIGTNLKGPFLCSQAVARLMIRHRVAGRIVNISSTSSLLARPGAAHYAASKAGLNMLTRVLAIELGPHGILVNAVCPGLIMSPGLLRTMRTRAGRVEHATKLARVPLGREGRLEDIAAMVAFLLSSEASYSTGSVFVSDGGYTSGLAAYDGRLSILRRRRS